MADKSLIEWTDATWNPITGCTLVDDSCRHCYAAHLITSWHAIGNHPSRKGLARKNAAGESKFTGEVRFNEGWLDQPLRWKNPRRIFVCAHGDLFHPSVPDEWIDKVFAVMALAPQHTFQVLTKRPERAQEYLTRHDGKRHPAMTYAALMAVTGRWNTPALDLSLWPLPNVWLGTSISDQASADLRIPHLLATPAAIRFVSAEPLLGEVDFEQAWHGENALDSECWGECAWCEKGYPALHNCQHGKGDRKRDRSGIDWVIVGGESGPHARPMHPDWARFLRDQCVSAGVPFLFKQWGEWGPGSFNMSTGEAVFRAFPNFQTWVNKGSTWVNGGTCMDAKGRICKIGADMMRARDEDAFPVTITHRVGKKRSGRLLDGVEWSQFPEVAA